MAKPKTKAEIEQDIASHPERGKIDGVEVVLDQKREVRATVSAELKRKLLRLMACYGIDTSTGVSMALALLWKEHRETVEAHESQKAIEFDVPVSVIQEKAYGHAKARGRQKRLNLLGDKND